MIKSKADVIDECRLLSVLLHDGVEILSVDTFKKLIKNCGIQHFNLTEDIKNIRINLKISHLEFDKNYKYQLDYLYNCLIFFIVPCHILLNIEVYYD